MSHADNEQRQKQSASSPRANYCSMAMTLKPAMTQAKSVLVNPNSSVSTGMRTFEFS